MHINNLYSLYDRKAGYYLPVFSVRSDADATRQFAQIVVTSDTPVAQYPADYDLVCVGSMDLELGYITPEHPVRVLLNGLVCLQNAQTERARYKALLADPQMDIEEIIGENP